MVLHLFLTGRHIGEGALKLIPCTDSASLELLLQILQVTISKSVENQMRDVLLRSSLVEVTEDGNVHGIQLYVWFVGTSVPEVACGRPYRPL